MRSGPHSPHRRELAAAFVDDVDQRVAERLRLDYLGFTRQPLYEPPVPELVDGPLEELANLVAAAVARAGDELAAVRASRRLLPPPVGHNQ